MHQASPPLADLAAVSPHSASPEFCTQEARQCVGQADEAPSDDSDPGVGEGRHSHCADAYRRMERAFLAWHVTGCMGAAAAYHKARQAWELALMEQGDHGA